MSVGCDPASHPTSRWIQDINEYQNGANPIVAVSGKAFCAADEDCSLKSRSTGKCVSRRCSCDSGWTGRRCTDVSIASSSGSSLGSSRTPAPASGDDDGENTSSGSHSKQITLGVAAGVLVLILVLSISIGRQMQKCSVFRRAHASRYHDSAHGDLPACPTNSANRFAWVDDDLTRPQHHAGSRHVLAPIAETPMVSFEPLENSGLKPIVPRDDRRPRQ